LAIERQDGTTTPAARFARNPGIERVAEAAATAWRDAAGAAVRAGVYRYGHDEPPVAWHDHTGWHAVLGIAENPAMVPLGRLVIVVPGDGSPAHWEEQAQDEPAHEQNGRPDA
jgi:hypothetical protein